MIARAYNLVIGQTTVLSQDRIAELTALIARMLKTTNLIYK